MRIVSKLTEGAPLSGLWMIDLRLPWSRTSTADATAIITISRGRFAFCESYWGRFIFHKVFCVVTLLLFASPKSSKKATSVTLDPVFIGYIVRPSCGLHGYFDRCCDPCACSSSWALISALSFSSRALRCSSCLS